MSKWERENVCVQRIVCTAYGMANNSYIIMAEGRDDCLIVDPSGHGEELLAALEELERKPAYILMTHGHYDHMLGIPALEEKYGYIPIAIHAQDAKMLIDSRFNLAMPFIGKNLRLHEAEQFLQDEGTFSAAGIQLKILHTPGHSAGSVCLITEDLIFSGDTLFHLGAGRTDSAGGDIRELIRSIGVLFALDDDYIVLPGHDRSSKIDFERKNNPFMKYYAPQLMKE